MYKHIRHIHFVGIGGVGMSGIAEVLSTAGYKVTGSDLHRSPITDRLRRLGISVNVGHRANHLGDAQVVVVSSAIPRSNPEIQNALRRGVPVIQRAEMLAELMRLKYGIAVAGSHGKTTTTSLIATVLAGARLDPTVVIGGRLKNIRSGARLGKGEFLVAEADESDGSFLHLNPTIAVVTNIDREHLDHYRDFRSLKGTFEEFVGKVPFYGLAIFCVDHPVVAEIAGRFAKRALTYGLGVGRQAPDITARSIRRVGLGCRFEVRFRGASLGNVLLQLPGDHNVQNSLAAIAVALELKVPFRDVQRALASFPGVARRFEVVYPPNLGRLSRRTGFAGLRRGGRGAIGGAAKKYQDRVAPSAPHGAPIIIDDYGHHPEEIRATLKAARALWRRKKIWVLFQPHRFTRTKLLLNDFAGAFGDADRVLVTDIYPAGEEPIRGVDGGLLARKVKGAEFYPAREVASVLRKQVRRGDVVITLGAGDIWKVGRDLKGVWGS